MCVCVCTFHSSECLTILLIYCDVYYVRFYVADKSEEISLPQQVALYCNTVCMIHIKIGYITNYKGKKGLQPMCVAEQFNTNRNTKTINFTHFDHQQPKRCIQIRRQT